MNKLDLSENLKRKDKDLDKNIREQTREIHSLQEADKEIERMQEESFEKLAILNGDLDAQGKENYRIKNTDTSL